MNDDSWEDFVTEELQTLMNSQEHQKFVNENSERFVTEELQKLVNFQDAVDVYVEGALKEVMDYPKLAEVVARLTGIAPEAKR